MNFGIRWEHACNRDLEEIYGSLREADPAIRSVEWRLARNPLIETWTLSDTSEIRLAWVKPYMQYPAVVLSFRIVEEPPSRYCLMLHARRTNIPQTG